MIPDINATVEAQTRLPCETPDTRKRIVTEVPIAFLGCADRNKRLCSRCGIGVRTGLCRILQLFSSPLFHAPRKLIDAVIH